MGKKRHTICPYCRKQHSVWWNKTKYRDGWYVTKPDPAKANGQRQVCLARGWESHDEAIDKWHAMETESTSGRGEDRSAPAAKAISIPARDGTLDGEAMRVGELVNLLLDNLEPKVSEKRYKDTKAYLTNFARSFGKDTVAQMRIGGVARVEKWLAKNNGWHSPSTKRSVITRVKQVFNFAVEQNYIATSPIKKLKRPKDAIRLALFSSEQADAILAAANGSFRDLFQFLLLTGCRPDEACSVTAEDVRGDGADLHLVVHHKNERHTGEKRVVYLLFSEAKRLVNEAVSKHATGALFRSKSGLPWTNATLNNYFRAITETKNCQDLGLDRHKIVKTTKGVEVRRYDYVPYVCRHTFAFRLLTGFYQGAAGNPVKKNYGEVAIYLGDSADMVEKVYGKLAKAHQMLGEEIG